MMRKFFVAATVAAAAAASANAQITFSNVTIGGSLAGTVSFATGPTDIDFTSTAIVGDAMAARSGDIAIEYIAQADAGLFSDQIVLSLLGALQGSGQITILEQVFDLTQVGEPIIANFMTTITDNADLPLDETLVFSTTSERVRVNKRILLDATTDTPAFDLASVALIEQNFGVMPEPASAALLAIGVLLGMRRRA
ncbi:MAG: hypothetical protein KDA32_12675 [Phycisphaerales bacterium]|nr:hypothetical protein [Phycisphaerales bacterium]